MSGRAAGGHRTRFALALAAPLLAVAAGVGFRQAAPAFDHARHASLFVTCLSCHEGVTQEGGSAFPAPSDCEVCHDGATLPRTDWRPRAGPRISNLRFDHRRHAEHLSAKADSSGTCEACHAEPGSAWMQVRAPSAPQCLSCHTPGRTAHLSAPDSACATCHLPLARAVALPAERVAKFPAPPSHQAAGFPGGGPLGHGAGAKVSNGGRRVAASCATCHARDFCAACHVNAPEVAAIQALEPDPRSLALKHEFKAPASHAAKDFEGRHGALAGRTGATCAACHTRESCFACHRAQAPAAALALYAAGPGRAAGAKTTGRAPASHTPGWGERHGTVAAASMRSCAGCHTRDYCLSCHVPDPARRGSYHPAGYLTRHPADAYSRSSSCADCHNTGEFCQTCHAQAGLSTKRTLLGAAGYHDGNRQFFVGHGQAARQALESCVSCHVERDCLTCHSVVKGRGFNPHGPGFDPERMLRKNPQLCIACHGTSIPRR